MFKLLQRNANTVDNNYYRGGPKMTLCGTPLCKVGNPDLSIVFVFYNLFIRHSLVRPC